MKTSKKRKFKKRYIPAVLFLAVIALFAYDIISFRILTSNFSSAQEQAQNCTCETNFEWMRATFEANDAGFHHILSIRGQEAYDIHNQQTLEKIRNAETLSECMAIMREWLFFFRTRHIGITPIINESATSQGVSRQVEERIFEDEFYEKIMTTRTPFLKELNENTVFLRIPSFDWRQSTTIDSVIVANREKILSTQNLIIDLRNNGGGADRSWRKLLPLIYTNPVHTVGVEFLSTELNNRLLYEQYNEQDPGFLARIIVRHYLRRLQRNLGEFVNLQGSDVKTRTERTIYPYPQNVGIIIDRGVASTSEQFLLAAKQSTKVTLFGTNTGGALDISNVVWVASPCNEFELVYGVSRSLRLPEMVIDEIGIAPDYHLDSIPRYKWVQYVNEILNQRGKIE